MSRADTAMFGLSTLPEYLGLAEEAVRQFEADKANVLKCFTAVLMLNHLVDWLHFKLTTAERATLALATRDEAETRRHFEVENADLTLVRSLANGFKHLRGVDPTGKIEGFGNGPFGIGPFGAPYLLIDLGEDKTGAERWAVADDLAARVLGWWRARLATVLV